MKQVKRLMSLKNGSLWEHDGEYYAIDTAHVWDVMSFAGGCHEAMVWKADAEGNILTWAELYSEHSLGFPDEPDVYDQQAVMNRFAETLKGEANES